MARVLGIDEAGRGCVIGPLVLAGVLVEEGADEVLVRAGVRDSKTLTPAARQALERLIVSVAVGWEIVEVSPGEIDDYLGSPGLNVLEARSTAQIVARLRPDVVLVDAPGRGGESYGRLLERWLPSGVTLVSENFADSKYPVVAAASILAKVRRDQRIAALRSGYGDFGSGYCSDRRTVAFLERWHREKGEYADIVRKKWKTALRLAADQPGESNQPGPARQPSPLH